MNITSTTIEVAARAEVVYELAAATARWPLLLPHYRYVRVREQSGARQIVEMAVWCDVFPLRWVAEQINDADRPHIGFRHLTGPTRGMEVDWRFESRGARTLVTIEHRLDFAFPVFAQWVGKYIVGDYAIARVAARTLAGMKRIAEVQR